MTIKSLDAPQKLLVIAHANENLGLIPHGLVENGEGARLEGLLLFALLRFQDQNPKEATNPH